MTFFESLRRELRLFNPGRNRRAARSKQQIHDLIATEQCRNRNHFEPGHLTASAIVLSPDSREFLLVDHRKLGKWLQPGGHVEPDDVDILGTARREVIEETGALLSPRWYPQLVNVDVHPIPGTDREPQHLHFDFVFLFQASSHRVQHHQAQHSDEPKAVAWCPRLEPEKYQLDTAVLDSLRRTRQFLDHDGRNRFAQAASANRNAWAPWGE